MKGADYSLELTDGLVHLRFERPEKYNAMTLSMWEALGEATAMLRDRDDTRALLLTSTGKYFSAGIDLNGPLNPDYTMAPSAFRRQYRQGIGSLHRIGDEWEVIEKPVIVGFQGPVLGGALELSLCADFRLASTEARLGLPEIALGGIPGSGGTSRLTRLAGPHWARWLVLANRQVDAEHARMIGLVHEVHPHEGFEETCIAFAREMAALPPEAFAVGKLAIELTKDLDRAQARNVERLAVSAIIAGDELKDMMEAMKARLAAKKKG